MNTRAGMLGAEVGQRIRKARLERGMTLAQLGGEDMSRSFLSLVESGRSRISLRALAIVADRLELPISYFVDDAAGGSLALAELALDYAEAALARQQPGESLRMLEEVAIPEGMRPRELLLRGRALADLGRPREAIPLFQEALSREFEDAHLAIDLRYELGATLYSAGVYDEALAHLRSLLDEVMLGPDHPVLVGKITVCIGHVLYMRGDVDGALEYYTRARELFGSLGDLDTLGCVYSGLSLAYKRKGDLTSALRYSRLSLGTFEAKQDARRAAYELNNVAVRYQELEQTEEALACAQEAARRAAQINDREIGAAAHSTLASIHLKLEQYDTAAAEAEAAERLAERDTDTARVDAWTVLARVAERRGEHARVDELYGRAIEAMERAGYKGMLADATLAYSKILQRRGETERALEFALRGLQDRAAASA